MKMLQPWQVYRMGDVEWLFQGHWSPEALERVDDLMLEHLNPTEPNTFVLVSSAKNDSLETFEYRVEYSGRFFPVVRCASDLAEFLDVMRDSLQGIEPPPLF